MSGRLTNKGERVSASHFGQIVELSTAGFIRRAPIERPLKLHWAMCWARAATAPSRSCKN